MDSTYGTAYWQQLSFLPQPAPAPMTMAAANTVVMLAPQFASLGGAAPQLVTLAPSAAGVVPPEMHAALSAAVTSGVNVSAPVSAAAAALAANADCETLIAEAHGDYRQGNYARALQYCQAVFGCGGWCCILCIISHTTKTLFSIPIL